MPNKRRRAYNVEKHVRLHRWVLRTAAWKDLSLGGRCTLVELYDLYDGSNNGRLFMSCRSLGERLSVRKDTAQLYLWDCEAHGFIKLKQSGAFNWKAGQATTWTLTEFMVGDAPPTKDFMHWKLGDVLTDRPRPGTEPKNKTRSRKPGQSVPKTGTPTPKKTPNCPENRDALSQITPAHGPENRDTDSIPRRGVLAEGAWSPQGSTPTEASDSAAPPAGGMTGAVAPRADTNAPLSPISSSTASGRDDRPQPDLSEAPPMGLATHSKGAPKKIGPASRAKNGGRFEIRTAADVTMALHVGVAWMDLAQQVIGLDIAAAKRDGERPKVAA